MKINFVLPGYPKPIGGYRVVYEYANELINLGYEVNIIHPAKIYQNFTGISIAKYIFRNFYTLYTKLKSPNLGWINYNKKINIIFIDELKNNSVPNADFIFATAWQTAQIISTFKKEKGLKFYLVQDFWPFMGKKKEIVKTWNDKNFYLVTVSLWLKKLCLENSQNKRIKYIPNAVNHKSFYVKKNFLIKKFKKFTILLMYSDGKYKNINLALELLNDFKLKYPNVEIKIFGKKTPPKNKILNLNYLGQISDKSLRILYTKSHVLLSTSKLEGGAGPVGEALASGCAVLTTEMKGSKDFIKNNYNGLVIKNANKKKLLGYLTRLYEEEKWRNKLILNGLKFIKKFKWKKSAIILSNLIQSEKRNHNSI